MFGFPAEDVCGDDRWNSMHNRYKDECSDIKSCDILLIGDSIVQQLQLTKFYEEYLQKGKVVYNAGIGGDLIEHVLWRIEDGDWIEKLNPSVVVLFVGTNNKLTTPERRVELLSYTINVLRKKLNLCHIVVPYILSRGEFPNQLRERNRKTNEILKEKYTDQEMFDKVYLVDMERDKIISKEGQISHTIMHDYLHLTEKGYRMTWNHTFDLCDKILEKR